MSKRYKLTVEDTETGDKHTTEVDIFLSAGMVKCDDGLNRSVCAHVIGNYIDVCRAYTALGAMINKSYIGELGDDNE